MKKNTHVHSKYNLVCGMEVHAELKTESKMFCGCKNDPFGAEKPNIYTCPVCLGMPGGLPVANKTAIEWTIKLGLALNCKINLFSKFDRKNYFYPDLPKSYQISQYDIPFCYDGYIETSFGKIGITRIHLEEDTGKLIHKELTCGEWNKDCPKKEKHTHKVSLIDFNRSSVPLVEIVTEPDIHSARQAKEYGRKLRQIIRYLDIGDCDMEQGGMRLEANISLQPTKQKQPPKRQQKKVKPSLPSYKVEVKNINSFRFVEQAITYEMERQASILEKGNIPTQETRGWNPNTGKTFSQRTKEDAEDYRYFPDPDLPPIRFTKEYIDQLKSELPELPDKKISRWKAEYGIEERYAVILSDNKSDAGVFEESFSLALEKKVKPNKIANAIVNKKVSVTGDASAQSIIKQFLAIHQTDDIDQSELEKIITQVILENPNEVEAYKNGKEALINFFVGQTMRKLQKKVDVQQVKQIIADQLQSE